MPRVYVAVDVPHPGLGDAVPISTHLTLAFLGEVDPARVPVLLDALGTAVRGRAPFTIVARGIGAFPAPERPRVVWVGIDEGAAALIALADTLRRTLADHRFAFDPKAFVPHVTILRVRRPSDRHRAAALLAHRDPAPLGGADVPGGDVMASVLAPAGARHERIRRLSFDEPA